MKLLGSVLAIGGDGFKTSDIFALGLGVAVIVFGLLPGANFFTELPTLRGIIQQGTATLVWAPVVCRVTGHLRTRTHDASVELTPLPLATAGDHQSEIVFHPALTATKRQRGGNDRI